jgi:hypothetical protein
MFSCLRPVILAISLMTVVLPNVASAASTGAPFEASYAGGAAFTSESTVHFSGSGTARLLGASTNSGDIVIHGPDPSCPGGLANTNVETLRAANGDILVLTMHDVSCPVGTNVYHGTGHWEVTGGTGRFLGASGLGTVEGGADFNQGRFAFTLVGTIVLAHQDHQ